MNSQTQTQTTTQANELTAALNRIGLRATATNLDDLIARATRTRLSPLALIEEITRAEIAERGGRNLQRLLSQARIGRFKPIADFDWNWPRKIDRGLIEQSLGLDFVREGRNLILLGANGLGKTMIAKNIAYAAATSGQSVIYRTASELLADLNCDSPALRRHKFAFYARPRLLCIDEVGYLSYDSNAADLMYEIVTRRYERNSILITTNRAFKDWNEVFPNAACIATMLDRLLHHTDVMKIEGRSYRVRESELESATRARQTKTEAREEKTT